MQVKEFKNAQGKVYCKVSADDTNKMVVVDWIGFLKLENLQEGSEGIIAAIKETGYNRTFIVNRQIQGPWDVANDWYATDWNPRAYAAGIEAMAVILSPNIFAQVSVNNFSKAVENKNMFDFGTFKDDEEAIEWLKKY